MRRLECCAWAVAIAILWFVMVAATMYLVFDLAFARATSHW